MAGVIVGARLGESKHIEDNTRVFSFTLDAEDHNQLNAVFKKSRDLYQLIGVNNSIGAPWLKQNKELMLKFF